AGRPDGEQVVVGGDARLEAAPLGAGVAQAEDRLEAAEGHRNGPRGVELLEGGGAAGGHGQHVVVAAGLLGPGRPLAAPHRRRGSVSVPVSLTSCDDTPTRWPSLSRLPAMTRSPTSSAMRPFAPSLSHARAVTFWITEALFFRRRSSAGGHSGGWVDRRARASGPNPP